VYRFIVISFFLFSAQISISQLGVARDTISVFENGYVLKLPWTNGLNFSNVSNIDLNGDGKKDLVFFDRVNQFGTGRFRCFIHSGNAGELKYKPALDLSYFFPQTANWATLLDFNCDGKEDLFCSTSAGIKVYKNTSSGSTLNFTLEKSLLYTNYGGVNGISNLYASSVGVPGIADVDNDGDLDILTFMPNGTFIEWHKNMSKELYNSCDSLVFEIGDACWGKISESQCKVTMNQCLPSLGQIVKGGESKEYHAGACLTCFDSDGDLDQDLLMGDIECKTIQYAHNTGTGTNALFSDTTSLYPNFPIKNNTPSVRINNFPCTYIIDVDGDNVKDLVATPNAFGSENYKSVWYYKNTSVTNTVNFVFVKNNLIQDEMIEVGQNAFPISIDYNSDGKKDLLIGNFGYYNNNALNARLTLYENIGTTSVPVYSLITRDYANLSTQNLNNVMPTVGDIDGDGDIDLCIGVASGQIHWIENTAGPGNVCNFSIFKNNPFNFTTASAVAAPQLFDLDGDGLLDLLIGGKNGRIAFYKNIGSTTIPSFSLVTNFLGGIDVKGNPFLFGLDGYAVPYFYHAGAAVKCLVGSISGNIWHFDVPANPLNAFTMISNAEGGLNEGAQSTVLFEDLNADGKRDLIVGNGSGGLTFFSSNSPVVGLNKFDEHLLTSKIQLYPNPSSGAFSLRIDLTNFSDASISIYDVSGRKLKTQQLNSSFETVDLSEFQNGLYFLNVSFVVDGIQKNTTKIFIKN